MRTLFIILSAIAAILGLALSILPFNALAFIPLVAAFLFGIIAFRLSIKEKKSYKIIKIIFVFTILGLAINIYNSLKPNEINIDQNTIQKEEKAEEETLEELEDLDID